MLNMNKKNLNEILQYSAPNSLFIVSRKNKLTQLFTPFRIEVLMDIGNLKKGEIVRVDSVGLSVKIKIVYMIKDQYYYYHYFNFLV